MARKKGRVKSTRQRIVPQALPQIQPHAAGIDLGSRKHWVAAPALDDGTPEVASFGTTTPELMRVASWLKYHGVTTVAMESTGVYWIPLFEILERRGFEVLLVNARQISHVPGRKTDMIDCQWIQLLHACGLLRGSFRPADDICRLRALIRERGTMVEQRADWIRRMQKHLDQMNVCVHHAVSDITGTTGMSIIRAIVEGERDPQVLAGLRDRRCKSSEAEIAEELTGNWREEHLFNLRQALAMHDQLCTLIAEYDGQIMSCLEAMQPEERRDQPVPAPASPSKANNIRKTGGEPLREALYRLSGFDLTTIDGIGADIAAVIIGELGTDLSMFPGEKHFISYLRLAPNLSMSAGKRVRSKSRATTCTRMAAALKTAATSMRKSQSALGAYYRRVARRKGASVAVFATARKIARLIYRMMVHGQAYVDIGAKAYEDRFRDRQLKYHTESLKSLGYKVVPVTSDENAA
jgi:transposase